MSIEMITLLLLLSLFLLIFTGLPLAFALGSVALIFSYIFMGPDSLFLLASRTRSTMFIYVMIAVPLFMFMASILDKSGLADDLYAAFLIWMGPIRGGLAMGTVVICTLMAAMSGVSAAAVLTMGIIALPAMLKRGYDKSLALGSITAGGALGQLIPPSILMVIYGGVAGVSVGKLFMGGVLPGLLLAGLFITYIGIRAFLQKGIAPALPKEERREITWRKKLASLKAIILPAMLIFGVLGSIFMGIATPTEAAAIGAGGSIICGLIHRRLTWEIIRTACFNTLKSTCMVMWIMMGSMLFVSFYFSIGGADFVKETLLGIGLNRWFIIFGMQAVLFVLGCMLDPSGIVLLCTPLFLPIVEALGFDPLWFGVLFIVNLEMAYLTPPFGYNLFYLKSVVSEDITMGDIYRSVWPFVLLQMIGLTCCMIFPQIILWLPGLMIGK
ncbi:MAG: TRAP transporter large permease subunit [Pseudomonadota bacterium]